MTQPVFTHDAVILGVLLAVLALLFYTSELDNRFFKRFYTVVPLLLLAYFVPALLNWPLGLIGNEWYDTKAVIEFLNSQYGLAIKPDISFKEIQEIAHLNNIDVSLMDQFREKSRLNFIAANYLLPACLIILTLNVDFRGIIGLGPKAIIMFLVGTSGIIIGAPLTLLIVMNFFPEMISFQGDDLWKGMTTISGSWIGGAANQTAMKEIFEVSDRIFASFVVVDVLVSNIWLGILLYGASLHKRIDRWMGADTSAIDDLTEKMESYRKTIEKNPGISDIMILLAVAFGGLAVARIGSDAITPVMSQYMSSLESYKLTWLASDFFWLIIISTCIGIILSFTKARRLEGVGASKWGMVFLYFLVATIGMKMNLAEIGKNINLFILGIIWMFFHLTILLAVGRLIKAPFFFIAVGSQANIGGVASASLIASAIRPVLAPVGVLLAVLGYAVGNYGGIITAYLLEWIAG